MRGSIVYRLLDGWMRLVARLVPLPARERWRTEWDGELWYGVAGKAGGVGLGAAFRFGIGLLRDALDARLQARVWKGSTRESEAGELARSLVTDARYGARTLRKVPGFTAVVVTTLALGIGATVTIFSVVNALLLNPLPYPDADRLVLLWEGRRGANVDKDWFSGGQFADIQSQTDAFEELALVYGASSTVTGRGRAVRKGWIQASSSYLRMLGAKAAIGRTLDDQDDRADAAQVALLTHGEWQRAYGGDPGIVGTSVLLDGTPVEIVGVLSPELLLDDEVMPTMRTERGVDLVLSLPLSTDPQVMGALTDRVAEMYNVVGRLRPGIALARAQAQLDRVAASIQKLHEGDPDSGFFIRAVPLMEEVVGGVRRTLLVLLGAVGVVLLIACVNVANLLLARGGEQRREMGIRASVGAVRGRLIRQLLVESAMLASMGGLLGVGLAVGALRLVQWIGGASLPRITEIGIDGRVLLFSLAITTATCLLFGLIPAWRASSVDPIDALKSGGRALISGTALRSRFDLPSALVVTEIALSLVLLVGGGLLTRSFIALQRVDPGFEADGRLTFRLSLTGEAYDDRVRRTAFFDRLTETLATLPGVNAVGGSTHLPFDGGISWAPVDIADYVPLQGSDHEIISEYRTTTPGYFEAMGIPLIRGRLFDARDGADDPDVAVIDQQFADTYFPDRDPIGMRLVTWGPRTLTIIGIVGTVRHYRLDSEPARVTTYLPQRQSGTRGLYMVLKTAGDPALLVEPAVRAVREMDADIAVSDIQPMTDRLAGAMARRRFSMALLQILGTVALALAIVGIHGLVSYRVSQGMRELSLRFALGATAGGILTFVLRHGVALAVAGIGIGLLAALAMTGLMRSMLYGVGTMDAWTFATVAAGLAATALLACAVPARRAARVSPMEAIRNG